MDVDTLTDKIKQNKIDTVYLVLGTQDQLRQKAKQTLLTLIPPEEQVMNVGSYDMEVTPLAVALDDASSAPFFGERRLVLINKPYFLTGETKSSKIQHDVDALQVYLEHPQPETVLVFLAPYEKLDGRKKVVKQLKKVAQEVDAGPLKEGPARQKIMNQIEQDGYQIQPVAMEELVQRTNADYSLMSAAVNKLELYSLTDKVISQDAVIGLVTQSLDQNVFDLVNAVLKRDQSQAIQHYSDLTAENEQPIKINAILVSQFRLLIQVKILAQSGTSQGVIASQLKVHPYRVKLAMQTVRQFNLAQLEQAYLGLIENETKLKTTSQSPQLLFELFMLQYNHYLKAK